MKKEEFYEAIGDIDEQAVRAAEKPPKKRSKRSKARYAVAAAACLALVLGIGYHRADQTEQQRSVTRSSAANDTPENNSNDKPKKNSTMLVASADYPEMPEYPELYPMNSDARAKKYQEWSDAISALTDQPEGYKDGFDSFFSNSVSTFLTDAEKSNKAYSPLGLYMALGITAEITDGSSRQQILDVLEQEDIDTLREHSKSIWQSNYMDDGMAKCILATSLWTNSNLDYKQDTVDSAAENYYSSVFSGDPASDEYNELLRDWMNEQTDGLLTDYASGIRLDPETSLMLASVVNYSGKWRNQFDKKLTKADVFHSANGDVECDFLNAKWDASYYWGENFTSVALGLENNGQMRLLLPNEGVSPEELLNDDEAVGFMLKAGENIEGYANSEYAEVKLSLPKFDVSSEINLEEGLKELGITDIFDPQSSDYSPLFEDPKEIYLYKAEQDTRVLIDEEGCKAVSLTMMAKGGSGKPKDRIVLKFDRPFVFEIMSETGLPLFVGIVNDPSV